MADDTKLVGAAFDGTEISKLTHEHGAEVLQLVENALTQGINKGTILQLLGLGGKVLLELITDLSQAKTSFAAAGLTQGVEIDAGSIFGPSPSPTPGSVTNRPIINLLLSVLQGLIQKYLPQLIPIILQQLTGSGALQAILTEIINAILNPPPAPAPAPAPATN